MSIITAEHIWLGSEKSYMDLQRMYDLAPDLLQMRSRPSQEQQTNYDEGDDNPVTYGRYGSVAVLNVSGPLIHRGNWMSQMLGIISYEDIKSRLAQMGTDSRVETVLINYDTPGGTAQGCKLCARFIREFSETTKPVVSFSESMAASAGYWLFAAGEQGVIDEEARLGSVGAIMVHTETSDMDRNMGVTRTVFRSAPYKALGTPYEKLSDEAKAEIKGELDYMHDQFVTGISELRGISKTITNNRIANGRMFRADESIRNGLADSQLSLEETVVKLAAAKPKKSAS